MWPKGACYSTALQCFVFVVRGCNPMEPKLAAEEREQHLVINESFDAVSRYVISKGTDNDRPAKTAALLPLRHTLGRRQHGRPMCSLHASPMALL